MGGTPPDARRRPGAQGQSEALGRQVKPLFAQLVQNWLVAQVVGAGYSLSRETGDVATFVKLLRVSMLLPVIVLAVAITRARGGGEPGAERPPLLPGFVIAFAALVAVNSTGWVPATAQTLGGDVSRWCLVAAMAAIGMKTRLAELATVGWRPVALMLGETFFLAALVLAWLHFGGGR